ncbi:MAG: hypothetical protein PHN59_07115, partial [Candidatus Omnitrophica bacterium]|nr:hypothetical protein [Candidatus Omnitrophota bacterium]
DEKADKPATEEKADEYAGWKTYTNNDIGYSLRYPADWTYVETNGSSEITTELVKYVTFSAPNGDSLHFGFQKAGDSTFDIMDRTGIGAGEDYPITEKAGTFLGETITPKAHVWENKVAEYFFDTTGVGCGCNNMFWFGLKTEIDWPDPGKSYASLDLVNKMFASVAWLDSDTSAGSETNLNLAKEAASGYLSARMTRDLEKAKPYMTDAFYAKMNQETFAGVSSPSFGSFSGMEGKYLSNADLYRITAKVHWLLQETESGISTWTLDVVNQNGKLLVNEVTGGYE